MAKAQMQCKRCTNEWEYSGLSCKTAICPACSTVNRIERQAITIQSKMGISY